MPKFGTDSLQKLSTIDTELQDVLFDVIQIFDFKVVSGKRGKAEQDQYYLEGRSTKRWPDSKHNFGRDGKTSSPALAVDIAPWPIDWLHTPGFVYLAGLVVMAGRSRGLTIRWGGNWDCDSIVMKDQTFQDLGHFELVI